MRRRLSLGDAPYMLSVGTIEPRKNGERLIRAFERAFADDADPPHLVFAGRRGWHSERVFSAAASSRLTPRIHFAGGVTDAELAALYQDATALLYPSLYEGFGLPVLEAMQAGVPVLTSTTSSMPEIADHAAVLVEPTDVDAIARGIRQLWLDTGLRAGLRRAGSDRAAQKRSWHAAGAVVHWKRTRHGVIHSPVWCLRDLSGSTARSHVTRNSRRCFHRICRGTPCTLSLQGSGSNV
jgi:glycosyltransferase involved in cell wall biosynthesis